VEKLDEAVVEMRDRYGEPPSPVSNLVAVARFRLLARSYGLTDVSLQGRHIRFGPLPLPDSKQLRLKRLYPDAVYKQATEQVSVPRPLAKREPMRDTALLDWCAELMTTVMSTPAPAAGRGA
jgi:transcription-repair coupling factor (superfamily II helicase)